MPLHQCSTIVLVCRQRRFCAGIRHGNDQRPLFFPFQNQYGANKVILGAEVAEALFGAVDPIGKTIKVSGRKLEVIGVIEKTGESLVQVMNFDPVSMISYELGRKMAKPQQQPQPVFRQYLHCRQGQTGTQLNYLRDELTWYPSD